MLAFATSDRDDEDDDGEGDDDDDEDDRYEGTSALGSSFLRRCVHGAFGC